jgi:uncharacterized protein (DUF362 family)
MVKGASIKFTSFAETVPKLLDLLKLQRELKKYDKIVLKPYLSGNKEESTSKEFLEAVLKFCLDNKNPVAEVFIAEGADGIPTEDLFHEYGLSGLAEKYQVGLVDLNSTETESVEADGLLKFSEINYPKILRNSFVISLPKLSDHQEFGMLGALSTMVGAFPASHYRGFFSKEKNKIRKWPIKYSIHDILKCKMPDFAVVDASANGIIMAGLPFDIDKQAAKVLGKDWQRVPYLNLLHEQVSMQEAEKAPQ